MRFIKFFALLLLIACTNKQRKTSAEVAIYQSDSLKAEARAINSFKQDIYSAYQSASKHNLVALSDSCIKVIYTVNGWDTLRSMKNLSIFQTAIRLTGINQIDNSTFKLKFSFFINDSVPITPELLPDRGSVFHTFDIDTVTRKITKGYLGQHSTYMTGENLYMLYKESLNRLFSVDSAFVNITPHPIYLRLLH